MSATATAPRDAFDDFMDELAAVCDGTWFNGKVAGVTHRNEDGSDRQELIRALAPHTELQLEPEPGNRWDPNAIRVLTQAGKQIGYLDGRLAGELTRRMKKGTAARCFVRAIREGRDTCGLSFGLLQYETV